MGALNNFCWLEYGLLVNDSNGILVRLVGGIIVSIYFYLSIFFYCYSIRHSAVWKQILCALTFYFILWVYLSYANSNLEFRKHFCGIVCSGMTVVLFGFPLVNLVHVIRTQSTSTLPFLMILVNFFVTAQWWVYGIIIGDNFLKVPYCLGWCLATVQLLIFVIFPSYPSDTNVMWVQMFQEVTQSKNDIWRMMTELCIT